MENKNTKGQNTEHEKGCQIYMKLPSRTPCSINPGNDGRVADIGIPFIFVSIKSNSITWKLGTGTKVYWKSDKMG